jgi:hypothetical protein
MKNKNFLTTIVLASLLIYFSCQKSSDSPGGTLKTKSDNDLVMAAKKYFNENVKIQGNTGEGAENVPGGSNKINHVSSLAKELRWDRAGVIQMSKLKGVVIPLHFAEGWSSQSNLVNASNRTPINSISKLLIYADQAGIYHAEVISAYPDSNFVKSPSASFTGISLIQDWNGKFLKGYKYEKGNTWQMSMDNAPAAASSETTNSTGVNVHIDYITTCYYNDWYDCDPGMGCVFDYTEELGCTTTPISGPTDQTVNDHDYNVISGSDPTSAPTSVNTITNLLNNPCFKGVLNNMISGGFKSELTSILTSTFGTSDDVNLTFKNLNEPSGFGDAGTNGSGSNGVYNIVTTLNTTALQNASREFVTETIFHEVIHAYLNINSTLRGSMPQHCEMIEAYVGCELAAMQEIFPTLSSHDGLCMILGGMADVQQYDNTTYNTVLANYNLTTNDVSTTNNNYKTANLGQGCGL